MHWSFRLKAFVIWIGRAFFFFLVWFGLNRKYKMLEVSSMTGVYC